MVLFKNMPREILRPIQRSPIAVIESMLSPKNLSDLFINNPKKKARILQKTRDQIMSFDTQGTVGLLKLIFNNLALESDSLNTDRQNIRDGALAILPLVDYRNIRPNRLLSEYMQAIDSLGDDADPFGSIDALLEAGKIITPHLPHDQISIQTISDTWSMIASRFAGDEERYISNKKQELEAAMIDEFQTHGQDLNNIDLTAEIFNFRRHRGDDPFRREELVKRRRYLLMQGFSEEWVHKLEESATNLYDPNVVNNKIALLKSLGFLQPIKLIQSLPTILGFAEKNIRRRIELLERLIKLYHLPFTPTELMKKNSTLFSTKLDKLMVLARILREYKVQPSELDKSPVRYIIAINLEDILVALNQSHPENETIADFMKRANSVTALNLSKEQKRKIIHEGLDKFPKIKARYFKGYPWLEE